MSKLGRENARMTALRKRRDKANLAAIRSVGKSMSRSARSAKKIVGGSKKGRATKKKSVRPTSEQRPKNRRPAAPLSPEALRVRLIAIAVAVAGGLLSLVIAPVGSPLCIAGVVAAVLARRIAVWVYGEGGSDDEQDSE